jgi:hypothetical protein
MVQLSISAACTYVRKALDELTSVEEIGMLVSPDAVDIHKLVEGAIVEAAVKIHNLAPSILLEGIKGVEGEDYDKDIDDKGVMTITLKTDIIRIASIKASDSEYVVCDLVPEDSAEGRKQLDEYVRGVPDDPRVVLQQNWAGDYRPVLKYYSCNNDSREVKAVDLYYVPYPKIDETIVQVCPRLEYAVLREITAMVLESLNEFDRAKEYRMSSREYIGNN